MHSNHKIRAVIFDMGGVLLRTEDWTPRKKLAEQLGITPEELYETVFESGLSQKATVGEITEEEMWQEFIIRFKLEEHLLEVFQQDFWSGDRLDEELVDYVRSLRPDYRTGLLSNAWSGTRASVSTSYQFLDAFDVSIFSAEVKLAKPDAEIYHHILDELNVEPQEAVFVDDVMENVEGAKKTGMHAIQFINREQTIKELNELLGIHLD